MAVFLLLFLVSQQILHSFIVRHVTAEQVPTVAIFRHKHTQDTIPQRHNLSFSMHKQIHKKDPSQWSLHTSGLPTYIFKQAITEIASLVEPSGVLVEKVTTSES